MGYITKGFSLGANHLFPYATYSSYQLASYPDLLAPAFVACSAVLTRAWVQH